MIQGQRQGSESPDGSRRLEIQNLADEDGFEEVTHSADLDDSKDDFDEKPDMEEGTLTPTKADSSLSFLDKDDEEFVDEPLSSPRLIPASDDDDVEQVEDVGLMVQPLSPTKERTEAAVVSANSPEGTEGPLSPAEDTAAGLESVKSEDEKTSDATQNEDATAPAAKSGSINTQEDGANASAGEELSANGEGRLSPHPDDQPAPLFARKSDVAATSPAQEASTDPAGENSVTDITETLANTSLEEGSGNTSTEKPNNSMAIVPVLEDLSKLESTSDSNNSDAEYHPVVGDFLKMQFVEHKVVPTVLVGVHIEDENVPLTRIGLLLPLSMEQLLAQCGI